MPKFRKKPVEIEAVRFTNEPREIEGEEPTWYRAARTIDPGEPGAITWKNGRLEIGTLEGLMTAQPGDWIIRGVAGEIYPCKPDIFAESYEAVA